MVVIKKNGSSKKKKKSIRLKTPTCMQIRGGERRYIIYHSIYILFCYTVSVNCESENEVVRPPRYLSVLRVSRKQLFRLWNSKIKSTLIYNALYCAHIHMRRFALVYIYICIIIIIIIRGHVYNTVCAQPWAFFITRLCACITVLGERCPPKAHTVVCT